jgi:hypothetical protein
VCKTAGLLTPRMHISRATVPAREHAVIFPRFGGLRTVSIRGVHYGEVQDLEEIYA